MDESVADAAVVTPNGSKTFLANGISTFFINGKPALRTTLKNCLFRITCIAKKKKSPGRPVKLSFYLIQTKYYFLFQMLQSP